MIRTVSISIKWNRVCIKDLHTWSEWLEEIMVLIYTSSNVQKILQNGCIINVFSSIPPATYKRVFRMDVVSMCKLFCLKYGCEKLLQSFCLGYGCQKLLHYKIDRGNGNGSNCFTLSKYVFIISFSCNLDLRQKHFEKSIGILWNIVNVSMFDISKYTHLPHFW